MPTTNIITCYAALFLRFKTLKFKLPAKCLDATLVQLCYAHVFRLQLYSCVAKVLSIIAISAVVLEQFLLSRTLIRYGLWLALLEANQVPHWNSKRDTVLVFEMPCHCILSFNCQHLCFLEDIGVSLFMFHVSL